MSRLYELSMDELLALRRKVEDETRGPFGLFLYSPAGRRKLDRIDRAISNLVREGRLARGEKVDDSGYSGRQTNRR